MTYIDDDLERMHREGLAFAREKRRSLAKWMPDPNAPLDHLTWDEFIALLNGGVITLDFVPLPDVPLELQVVAHEGLWREFRARFPIQSDLWLLHRISERDFARFAHLWHDSMERIVAEIPWRVPASDQRLSEALTQRARESGQSREAVKHLALQTAVLLTLGELEQGTPDTVRFDRHWLVWEESGVKAEVDPNCLAWPYLWKWFKSKTRRLAKSIILEDFAIGNSLEQDQVEDGDTQVIEAVEDAPDLWRILTYASPRQRELAALLFDEMDLDEAAIQMNIAPATARKHLEQLRKLLDIRAKQA